LLWDTKVLVDLFSPIFLEIVNADILLAEDTFPLRPGELSILFKIALGTIRCTEVRQVWHDLGDLVAVDVVWEDEWSNVHVHEVRVLLALDV